MSQKKVAIITGASQGIGVGVVAAYRKKGYAVIANSRNIKPGDDDIVAVAGGTSAIARSPSASFRSRQRWSTRPSSAWAPAWRS